MNLRADFREIRQKEAAERSALTSQLTPQQWIERLDQQFGKGLGAKAHRARLRAKIMAAAKKAVDTRVEENRRVKK